MLTPDYLLSVLEDSTHSLRERPLKEREILPKVRKSLALEEATILIGPRRAGKTSLMGLLIKDLKNALYINFEDERLYGFSIEDFSVLESVARKEGVRYLFLDEVQNVKGWEKFVHRAMHRFKFVVSASNAALLKEEFAYALTGRTITFEVYPLSYREFLSFTSSEPGRASFLAYMGTGGFPSVVLTGEKALVKEFFTASIYRDAVRLRGVRRPELLERLALYLLSNVGKEFSYRRIASFLGVDGKTAKEYVKILEDVFLLRSLPRYASSLRRVESYNKKAYAIDVSLAMLGMRVSKDEGRLLENTAFSELLKVWEGEMYFYKDGRGEVDFILAEGLRPRYGVNVFLKEGEGTDRELYVFEVAKALRFAPLLLSLFPSRKLPAKEVWRCFYKIEDCTPQNPEKLRS